VIEQFRHFAFDAEQSELLLTAEALRLEYAYKGWPLTVRQLHGVLRDRHVLSYRWEWRAFSDLAARSWMGGRLDWDVVSEQVVDISGHQPAFRWIFTRAQGLSNWIQAWATLQPQPCSVSHGRTYGHSLHQLRHASDLMHQVLDQPNAGPISVLYLADAHSDNKVVYNRLRHNLIRMLRVRQARRQFNDQYGNSLWKPHGILLPRQGRGSGLRNRVSHHLTQAAAYIDSHVRFTSVTPPGDIRRLRAVEARVLDKCIHKAWQTLERVPGTKACGPGDRRGLVNAAT
jgi:hypothetical protein